MKVGIVQLSVGDDPALNLPATTQAICQAFDDGADLVCTPEVTGFITTDSAKMERHVATPENDLTLAALRGLADQYKRWIAIGSLAVRGTTKYHNRSFLIAPDGSIAAQYDKIHLFDVEMSATETYRESKRYKAGDRAVTAQAGDARLGLSICYDLRFPHLYRTLAQAGADILLVPSAFSPATGPAHWAPLLTARAIETGCYVIAAAQCGTHVTQPKPRSTYGHSMVISPWGEVLLDMGTQTGVRTIDLDLTEVAKTRKRIPSLMHDRFFEGPK